MWLCATRILDWLRVALVGNKLNTKLSLAIVMKIIKPHLKLTCHVFYIFYREKKSCQNLFFWWYFFFIVHNNFTENRAYSSSLLRAIIARSHLPFFKILSNFVHFCPNFQIFCRFLPFYYYFYIFLHFWKIARMPLLSRIDPGEGILGNTGKRLVNVLVSIGKQAANFDLPKF